MSNKTIQKWQEAISNVAYDETLKISKKDRKALTDVLDMLDDLLVQGAVYKD